MYPYRPFTPQSYWNTPLPIDVPTDPDSRSRISWLAADNSADFVRLSGTGDSGAWGMPVFWATPRDPLVTVSDMSGKIISPEFARIRVPADLSPDPTSDGAVTVYDLAAGYVYSLWRAVKVEGGWRCEGAALHRLDSDGLDASLGTQPANFGHRGIPSQTYCVRLDQIQDGKIDHVLKVAVNTTRSQHVYPCSAHENRSSEKYAPPEGMRMRIKRTVSLSKLGLSPFALVIAKAMQDYGILVGDNSGGDINLKVENTVAEGRGQVWTGLLEPNSLSPIELAMFEVVKLGWKPA